MKRISALLLLILVAAIGVYAAVQEPASKQSAATETSSYLTPAESLRGVHGLAVDAADSNKLWIATHSGLHLLRDDKDLFYAGSARDDYMGFAAHPTEPETFYSSGHPQGGGNIGFKRTTDGGRTWQKLSDGVNGPVDFHALAVSQKDPKVIFGVYQGQLQISNDGGNNWQVIENTPSAITLATSPDDAQVIYMATQNGLQISRDQGKTWSPVGLSGAVYSLAVNPKNGQELLAYTPERGLVTSSDGAQSWQPVSGLDAKDIMYFAYDRNNPQTVYAIAQDLGLHKTSDGGTSWRKVR